MNLTCGIVGLPNAGKSTFFNALTRSRAANVANFPFCTIEPNHGVVSVPDGRLDALAHINESKNTVPAHLLFTDIAGIVEGASKGHGLGNKFLGHIRGVDMIVCLLRCFEDDDVMHVKNKVDPLDDLATIETELMLADLESCQRRLEKKFRRDDRRGEALRIEKWLGKAYCALKDGRPARDVLASSGHLETEDMKAWRSLGLLTQKRVAYVLNVDPDSVKDGNELSGSVEQAVRTRKEPGPCLRVCAQLEQELLDFSPQDQAEYLSSLGIQKPALDAFVETVFRLLDLSTFFTCGPKETRAWPFANGMTAAACAGLIHSDFERGFIRAEVTSYGDYMRSQGEKGARTSGKLRSEGRDYIMQDGDVVHFRFNV